jgi:hypothetical protein
MVESKSRYSSATCLGVMSTGGVPPRPSGAAVAVEVAEEVRMGRRGRRPFRDRPHQSGGARDDRCACLSSTSPAALKDTPAPPTTKRSHSSVGCAADPRERPAPGPSGQDRGPRNDGRRARRLGPWLSGPRPAAHRLRRRGPALRFGRPGIADVSESTEGLTAHIPALEADDERAGRKVGVPYGSNPAAPSAPGDGGWSCGGSPRSRLPPDRPPRHGRRGTTLGPRRRRGREAPRNQSQNRCDRGVGPLTPLWPHHLCRCRQGARAVPSACPISRCPGTWPRLFLCS